MKRSLLAKENPKRFKIFVCCFKKRDMLDFITLLFVVAAAIGFTYVARKKKTYAPNLTEGPVDHSTMPEVEYVYPMEADTFNASSYELGGKSAQDGAFRTSVFK